LQSFSNIFTTVEIAGIPYFKNKQTSTETSQMIEFNPPFQYSYECSSSFLAAYAIVFIEMYLMSGFGLPLLKLIVLWIIERYEDVWVSDSDSFIKLQTLSSSGNQVDSENQNISYESDTVTQQSGDWSETALFVYKVFRKTVSRIKLFREVDKTATVLLFVIFFYLFI
jgi:hypothetical protein